VSRFEDSQNHGRGAAPGGAAAVGAIKKGLATALLGLALLLASAEAPHACTITVDLTNEIGTLKPSLLGVNHAANSIYERVGFDTVSMSFPPAFYVLADSLGLKCWRFPGGDASGSYFWWKGLGDYPRPPGFGPYSADGRTMRHYYYYGFMEFMDFMEDIGAVEPVICLNFGTDPEAAAHAADWVEFANADVGEDPNGDGVDWAAVRDSLGRHDPYGITYWEIGNELGCNWSHMWSWNYGQKPDGSESLVQRILNFLLGGDVWQYKDQQRRETMGQYLVKPDDWRAIASYSNGGANQRFYIKYPPACPEPDSIGLYVDMSEWHLVDSFEGCAWDDSVYTFDADSGIVAFGDGANGSGHGLIPPDSALVRAQYKAVGKYGADAFYEKMKAVDDSIRIGVPFQDDLFLDVVYQAHQQGLDPIPFDCISIHPYQKGRDIDLQMEHWRLQDITNDLPENMLHRRARLDSLFGQEKYIGLILSEYNIIYAGDWHPGDPNPNPWYHGRQLDCYGKSLGHCLALANSVLGLIRVSDEAGIEVLNYHSLLTGSDEGGYIAGWPMTALAAWPVQYVNPTGLFYSLLTKRSGDVILEPEFTDCPMFEHDYGDTHHFSMPYLTGLAMKDPAGDSVALFIINRASGLPDTVEKYSDITAQVSFVNAPEFDLVQVYEINADSLWYYNSEDNPDAVSLARRPDMEYSASLEYTFPAHSITVLVARNIGTGVADPPLEPALHQNRPNPFNPATSISFDLPAKTDVKLTIYNVAGKRVRTLVEKELGPGPHTVQWDGRDERGRSVASGVYLYRLEVGDNVMERKAVLIR